MSRPRWTPRSACSRSHVDYHLAHRGTTAEPLTVLVTPETAGWGFSGLRVLELGPGRRFGLDTGEDELLVLPLSGSCEVHCDGDTFTLAGRPDVFAGRTDFAYAPRDSR